MGLEYSGCLTCVSAFAAAKPANDYGKLPLTFEAERRANRRSSEISVPRRRIYDFSDGGKRGGCFPRAHHIKRRTANRPQSECRCRVPNGPARFTPSSPRANISNYYYGSDPKGWLTGVRHYGRVSYEGVYPGIDVVYYGNQRQLEYDFVVSPGANPNDIRLKFDGADRIATASMAISYCTPNTVRFASGNLSFIRKWMANGVSSPPATRWGWIVRPLFRSEPTIGRSS